MKQKHYQRIRAGVALFVGLTVSMATMQDSYILAAAGVGTGMLFLGLVRSKLRIRVDERERLIQEKAARWAYGIFAPTIGLGSFFLIMAGERFPYLMALGQVFAYLTLYFIAVYALAFHFLNRKLGGDSNEE